MLAQNPKLLAFDFTQKRHFMTKIDQNSIFFCREAHIPDQLYITFMHISFY
jgi:hypothetical protein